MLTANHVQLFEKEKTRFTEATAITVRSRTDRQLAADLWDAIRKFRKDAEAQKEEVCRPLKTAWDQAKVPFDIFVKECQGHEATLQGKMSAWDREQDRLAKIEQDRLQAIADKANAKIMEKAEAKGIEPVLKVAPVVQAPPKSIETQAGTTQSRSTRKVYGIRGVNPLAPELRADSPLVAQLLKDYPALFVLDRVKFNALAKTGMLDGHPCVEITEEYVYSQR
jgi:hypothetical protein